MKIVCNNGLFLALRKYGLTQQSFSKEIDVEQQTVSRWIANGVYPHPAQLYAVASFFKKLGVDEEDVYKWFDLALIKRG